MDLSSIGLNSLNQAASRSQDSQGNLGQNDFLELMITQFQNQDPLKPLDNQQFLAQLAQFSTVAGVTELNQSFADLSRLISADQALQASSLVGRDVLVDSDSFILGEDGARGGYELPSSTSGVQVEVLNENGERVRLMQLGAQPVGLGTFEWDGKSDQGQTMPQGLYHMRITAEQSGKSVAVPSLARAPVESVYLGGQQGAQLNLQELGTAQISWVRQLY